MFDLDAYFARIGYDGPREATLDVLRAIQARHPAAIPFEAVDVLLGRGVDISIGAVQAKLVAGGRGGYCFEHNTLLLAALHALGFEAEPLLARVVWNRPHDAPPGPRTHMVLRVVLDGRPWLADVGFGGAALPEPIRFAEAGPQTTVHEAYRLAEIPGGLRLDIDLPGLGWARVYEISFAPQVQADFEAGNWWTSAHPTSHFRANLMVSRTTPETRFALLHNRFTTRRKGVELSREALDADGLEQTLREVFGLPVTAEWRPVLEQAVKVGDGV